MSATTLLPPAIPGRGGPSADKEQAPATAMLVAGAPLEGVDLAVSVWLDAKAHKTQSARTRAAYAKTLASFRALLCGAGLDLDAANDAVVAQFCGARGDLDLEQTREHTLATLLQGWAGRTWDGGAEVAPATFNQRLAIVSSFYAFTLRRRLLTSPAHNPALLVERRSVQPFTGAHALHQEETGARLAAIDRSTPTGARDYALLALALETGHRAAELAALRWGDLEAYTAVRDETASRVTCYRVIWRRCKGGKQMQSELTPETSAAIQEAVTAAYGRADGTLPRDAPLWLSCARGPSRGRAIGTQTLADIWQRHLGTSKVHATRHTFAATLEHLGAKVSEIQHLLGHASLATTGRYLEALSGGKNPHAPRLAAAFGIGGPIPIPTSTTSHR